MNRKLTLSGKITALKDADARCVIFEIDTSLSLQILAGLTGLELGRVGVVEFLSDNSSAAITGTGEKRITVSTESDRFSFTLSKEDCELIKCCCLDAFLNAYPDPHIDLELGGVDFTVAFR